MASVASPVERGVPPIRAGKGHSFFLRRLHSLSGIVPVGAFLLEHFISNAFATNGPNAYGAQVKFLTGLPFVPILETVGIYIPLLYHALYGFYIWFRGESNVSDYPWAGNFMYAAQRWTGASPSSTSSGIRTPCALPAHTCSHIRILPLTRCRRSFSTGGLGCFIWLGSLLRRGTSLTAYISSVPSGASP